MWVYALTFAVIELRIVFILDVFIFTQKLRTYTYQIEIVYAVWRPRSRRPLQFPVEPKWIFTPNEGPEEGVLKTDIFLFIFFLYTRVRKNKH